jgi:hypothetical protein
MLESNIRSWHEAACFSVTVCDTSTASFVYQAVLKSWYSKELWQRILQFSEFVCRGFFGIQL